MHGQTEQVIFNVVKFIENVVIEGTYTVVTEQAHEELLKFLFVLLRKVNKKRKTLMLEKVAPPFKL